MTWLSYEVSGYPQESLDPSACQAAERSNRRAGVNATGPTYWTSDLGTLAAEAESARTELGVLPGGTSSSDMALLVEREKAQRASNLRAIITARDGLVQRIVGAFYEYAAGIHRELRFGGAVESAFEVVRDQVDAAIADLVPQALPKLSAAFENAAAENPEDWASAAAT
jgi:hypothetical protein